MSDKSNRITVKSFPGSKVDDMRDYVKPFLKANPDNLILHIGTNNLKSDDARTIAEVVAVSANI